jgi:hypothetical protein
MDGPCSLDLPFMNLEHSIGVNVSDTRHEMATDAVTVTANSRNRRPMIPPRRRIGMNTAISEKLIDNTVSRFRANL